MGLAKMNSDEEHQEVMANLMNGERGTMEYIEFGYGYRLHRRDSANWELQEFRKPSSKGFAKNTEDKSPKWCDCGMFFQSLSAALTAVYGLVLRKDEEGALQIMQALDRAEKIERDLKAVAVDLTKLQ